MRTQRLAGFSVAALVLLAVSGTVEAVPTNSFSVVIPHVDVAAPGETQTDPNLITWKTFDDFSGSTLDTGRWRELGGGEGTITTGAAGLTFTPLSLSDLGRTNLGIQMNSPITLGDYFAVRVPFQITNVTTDLPGTVGFNIDLCGPHQTFQCDSLSWNQAQEFSLNGGAPLSGKAFASEGVSFLYPTTVSKGELAIIYKGDAFTNYFNDGTGWHQLGTTFVRPTEWAPLLFEMDAEVRVVPGAGTGAVPEPTSLALIGIGLAGMGFLRHRKNIFASQQ